MISAHKNGPSKIKNGPLTGYTLLEAWQKYPSLFGKETSDVDFPLLVKIIDANDDLSVQVHPDDSYARKVENEPYGKTECWYILDCESDSEIVFGHHAQSKEEFKQMIEANEWDNLLARVKVNKGDFFYVPSGTIHAIGKGIVILEIQQSSDITYRLYDYDRKDSKGNPRELHIESAIEVTKFPHDVKDYKQKKEVNNDLLSTQLIRENYFTVYHWNLAGNFSTPLKADYLLMSVINGSGEILINNQSFPITKGCHFVIPSTVDKFEIKGELEIVVSHETSK